MSVKAQVSDRLRFGTIGTTLLTLGVVLGACGFGLGGTQDGSSPETSPPPVTSDDSEATTTTSAPGVTVSTTGDFVRFIHPDEWTLIRSTCLVEAGWPVDTTPDGGIDFSGIPSGQQSGLEAAIELCDRRFPVDPRYRQPLTETQLTILYNWYVTESIPCLEGEGFTGINPPSLDVFLDTYETEEHWAPYLDISSQLQQLQPGRWYDLNEACPQNPPVDELFGD